MSKGDNVKRDYKRGYMSYSLNSLKRVKEGLYREVL